MEKESPEKMFAINDTENAESYGSGDNIKVDGDANSSEKEEKPDEDVISSDFTLESLKEHIKKNDINIDDKTINNYYNQIIDNKTYIQEYDKTIQQLGELKKEYDSKIEERGDIPNSSEISKRILSVEEKLANLNVEKQKKEDNIKGIINEIYNSQNNISKVENVSNIENNNKKSINFKSKNELLNLTINSTTEKTEKVEDRVDKKEEVVDQNKNKTTFESKQPVVPEKVEEKMESKQPVVPEKVEETAFDSVEKKEDLKEQVKNEKTFESKQPVVPEKVEEKMESKQPVVPEKVEETSFDSVEKKENPKEQVKNESVDTNNSEIANMFKKISDDMSKGFESVLSALGSKKEYKEEPAQKAEEKTESYVKPSSYDDKPERKQQNYIDDYRKSLRSNAPLEGMVGIKGLDLKVNNIGSYV